GAARGVVALHRRALGSRRAETRLTASQDSAMSQQWNGPSVDWRPIVRQHADRAGVDLPQATVDEMALHLDDLYAGARALGQADEDARAQALAALDESSMSILQRHAARNPRRQYIR